MLRSVGGGRGWDVDEAFAPYVARAAGFSDAIYNSPRSQLIHCEWTDADARVEHTDSATYVVFRGSESRRDWFMNLAWRCSFEPVRGGSAHGGFVRQWLGVRDSVLTALRSHARHLPVVLCGHSLGGAVAAVAALELQGEFACTLVTFGSPRVFDAGARREFERLGISAYRVTNGSDVVTMVPIFCVHHVGERVEINRRPCWYVASVRDHSMSVYAAWARTLRAEPPALTREA